MGHGASSAAPSRADEQSRRELCVWLAELASYRGGLIGALVRPHHPGEPDPLPLDMLLDMGWRRLAARVGRPRCGQRRRDSEAAADAPCDRQRVADLLAEGPRAMASVVASNPAAGDAVVTWCDAAYPPLLRALRDPPPALFVRSHHAAALQVLTHRATVAVVGARGPSRYGREMASLVAGGLVRAGVVVVSGMAAGIDALAHAAALDASAPGDVATVAVLGCGADVVYPRCNRALYERIGRHGLVVSEFTWGVPSRAWRFPARNRVMAGLSQALVMVEGGARSGALITVRHALDVSRDVFAVPGEAGRRLSAGPHHLLRHGAGLCESAADVLTALHVPEAAVPGIAAVRVATPAGVAPGQAGAAHVGAVDAGAAGAPACPSVATSALAARCLEALDDASATPDQLAARSGGAVAEVCRTLALLEVDGLVEQAGGGTYRRRRAGVQDSR